MLWCFFTLPDSYKQLTHEITWLYRHWFYRSYQYSFAPGNTLFLLRKNNGTEWTSLCFRIYAESLEDSFSGDSGLSQGFEVSCQGDLHKIPPLQTGDSTSLQRKADLIALWVETFSSFIKPANYPHI